MANEVLKRAISIAHENNALLVIVHDVEPPFFTSPYLKPIDDNEIKKKIMDQVNLLNEEANIEYSVFIQHGRVADSVINIAKKTNADLLIIGLHGKDDTENYHFGSNAFKIIQKTHIPMLIVKNKVENDYKSMIAPTNLAEESKKSILFAHALFPKVSCKYLYAHEVFIELQGMQYRINEEQRQAINTEMAKEAWDALEAFVKETGEGDMAFMDYRASINEDLLNYIVEDQADLLVLGSKGIGNLNSFVFGSTASYLLRESPTDILIHVPNKN